MSRFFSRWLRTRCHGSLQGKPAISRARRPSLDVEELESRVQMSGVPTPDHVVIVMEENHGYTQIIGSSAAPYINSLASQGALMTNSFGITHPSQPNYIAFFSGSLLVTDNNDHNLNAPNLGSSLIAAGATFGSYSQGLPYTGFTGTSSGAYVRRHNASASFTNLPSSVNMPFSSFPTDFSQLPAVSIVAPDLNNDMHDGTIQKGDTWLKDNLDAYKQWAMSHNSLLIVTFDEDNGAQNNHIASVFVGPMVKTGQYAERIDHYNMLRTIEEMYGVSPYLGASATATPITDIWTTTSTTPVVSITASDPLASEPSTDTGTFLVSRTGDTSATLNVPYTVSGTATSGLDFIALAGTVNFPAGSATAAITLTVKDDPLPEGNETVIVTLSAGASYTLGTSTSATVTIADDETTLPTVTIATLDPIATEASADSGMVVLTRTGSTAAPLTVSLTNSGTATNGADYTAIPSTLTIPAGAASATITVTALEDAFIEGNETVVLGLATGAAYTVAAASTATVTIRDKGGPTVTIDATDATASEIGQDPGIFTITRTGPTTVPLTVRFLISGTATHGLDWATISPFVTIPVGASSATIVVTPLDDGLIEQPENAVLTLLSDANYNVGQPGSATITITDNDTTDPSTPLVSAGSMWKFKDDGVDLGTAWQAPAYNDSTWNAGPAKLGFGDPNNATVLHYGPDANSKYRTTYFRTSFDLSSAAAVNALKLRLLRDDGAVVYLNGVEVFRSNMPTGTITYSTKALAAVDGADETKFFETAVDRAAVVTGINVIAVEIHQDADNSPDLGFDLELLAALDTIPPEPPSTPLMTFLTDTGVDGDDGITSFVKPAFDGTAEPGSTVKIYSDSLLAGTGVAGVDGKYTIVVNTQSAGPHTIYATATDVAGNVSGPSSTATIVIDPLAPTADIVDVTPDPRESSVNEITILFSEPIISFDISDLKLARNGGANLLTAAQTLTTLDDTTWILGNLNALTTPVGTYVLSINAAAAGISDEAGNVMNVNAGDTFTVNPPNTPPTLDALSPVTLNEDASTQGMNLTGISVGGPDVGQTLTVTATSSNTALIPNPTVNYTSPNANAILLYTPAAQLFGATTITVTVTDSGATNNTVSRSFTVTVLPVNDPPTLNAIAPAAFNEDAVNPTVGLSGISAGPANENGQTMTVTAVSSNLALVPNPAVTYTSPNSTGKLTFAPVANANGTASITVTVNDGQGANNIVSRTFPVTLNPVNDPPTLAPLNPMTLNEDAATQTVALTGITAGPADETGQSLSVTATSSNPALIPNPIVSYAASASTGTLSFTPVADANGTATITVTVNDGQGANNTFARTFTVTVNAVNDAPTLDTPTDVVLNEDAPTQTAGLSGISAGPANEFSQPLSVSAVSNNPGLIPNPTVSYASPNATGTLTFKPLANAFGAATITVTVNDGQGTNNAVSRTFAVSVAPVNDAPTLDGLNPLTLNEDAATQTVVLTGISAGPVNEAGQPLSVSISSSNPGLIPKPAVSYASPDSSGTITFTPQADASGTATISVTVNDGQGVNNSVTRSFTVIVNAINDEPTLDPLNPVFLNEDGPAQTVELTGITAGPDNEVGQPLSVTATSSNPAIIPNPIIAYAANSSTGSLTFTPLPNANGSVTITVTVNDGQGTHNTVARAFVVSINAINDPPTLDTPNAFAFNEDGGTQAITLTGISAGPANEVSQPLTITASSSNPALISNPQVTYSGPASTGTLTFTPGFNLNGTATVTVTVNDGQGANNAISRSFAVTVNPVNDSPTLDPLGALLLDVDAPAQTVTFFGISPGPDDETGQGLTVTAVSSNPALVPQPTVTYANPDSTGTLNFKPVAGGLGTATITVTVNDGQGINNTISRSFPVTITPVSIDAAGRLIVNGSTGNDTITVTESATDFTVALSPLAVTQSYAKSQVTGRVVVNGQAGSDVIILQAASGFAGPLRGAIIRGGEGQDTITSGGGNDVLIGGNGEDQLNSLGGNDVLIGGDLSPTTWTVAVLDALANQWGGSQNTSQEAALLAALIDNEADVLSGGSGRDWFFARGGSEGQPGDFEPTGPLGESPFDRLTT